jgi:hypothetical protein
MENMTDDAAPEPGEVDTTTWYMVSGSPDRIDGWADGTTSDEPVHYQTSQDAVDGITGGFHGETGTRYILTVTVSVAAVAERGWTLRDGTLDRQRIFESSPDRPPA